ncbi:trypsin-like serine protease [Streptomyces sp. NPDC054874]
MNVSRSRSHRALTTAALAAAVAGGVLIAPSAHAVIGTPVGGSDTTYAYTAQITIGEHDRGCSATLVDAEWLLTAASCFADDPAVSLAVPAGAPQKKTTAVIGRSDLSGTQGAERGVVELVPRTDRDVVLARLNRPVTDVTPATLATAAPAAGAELTFAGYGRTKTEWAPLQLHTGTYTVNAATATGADVTGKDGQAACMGDTGGPVLDGGKLVGLNSQSYQGGCLGVDEAQTSTAGVIARVDDLSAWVKDQVGAAPVTDFNGDGVEDIAISDPKATVGGDAGAGLVRIVYGGGRGTAEINQDLDTVVGGAEAGDAFGESLATVDYNEDGYTDLVVGSPGEAVGSAKAAGFVDVLYGAKDGLLTGQRYTHLEQGAGTGAIATSVSEAADRMGHSLAAGTTAEGRPWILIGVPGEAIGSLANAGMAFYVYGDTSRTLHQDLPAGVPGAAEADDRFGASVAGGAHHFAIGVPGEAIGDLKESGTVALFSHQLDAEGRPTSTGGLDQDNDAVTGAAEVDDEFGASLAMVDYRPSAAVATANTSILAIGSPGEATTGSGTAQQTDAGRAVLVRINPDSSWTYLRELRQATADDDVAGTSETDDRMAESLSAVNTAPREVGSAETLKLAVGTPGEALGTVKNAGAIHTFSLIGSAGANDLWIEAGDGDGIPGPPGAGHKLGQSVHFTGTHLYAGMPFGPSSTGALHVLPISNVVPGGVTGTVITHQPGAGGLPASGADFGYAAR